MEDEKIIALYWERNENAVRETNAKYGRYCYTVAYNILHSHEDSEECVNDTWNSAWNIIPPEKPTRLQSFLARITRNIAIDRYRYENAQKRSAEIEIAIDEYWECIPNQDAAIEDEVVLEKAINGFLASLDTKARIIFMRRYWFSDSYSDISKQVGLSEKNVSVRLTRIRKELRKYLSEREVLL